MTSDYWLFTFISGTLSGSNTARIEPRGTTHEATGSGTTTAHVMDARGGSGTADALQPYAFDEPYGCG